MDQHSPSAPRTSESSENDLAKRLWHHGFRRWLEVNPRWTMGRPFTAHRRVYFPVTDATRSFQIVVEDATLASQSEFRGRHLALRAQGELPSPRVVNELGQIVMRLDAKGLSFPAGGTDAKRVELFISSACNLQCYFCIESERINSRSFMPWETIEKHLRENAARGVQLIQFMGGEATIHPRFVDALRLCRELGMRTFVITNLLRWARMDFAEEVKGLLDEVMISLHAFGDERGTHITGHSSWWRLFNTAFDNFLEHRGEERVRIATVMSRSNVDDLEKMAALWVRARPERWIMGNAVPIDGTRIPSEDEALRLSELRELQPKFIALSQSVRAHGCRLIFFCFPHCVLGESLWDDTHDDVLDDQDLSDNAAGEREDVNFWSRAEYHEAPKPVTLGRMRPESCSGCERRSRCGGHFSDYFRKFGTSEIVPVRTLS